MNSTVRGHINEENLKAFADTLSWLIQYPLDYRDWDAIGPGVARSDLETNNWFNYSFCGPEHTIEAKFAYDNDASWIDLDIFAPEFLCAKIEMAVFIFQSFSVAPFLIKGEEEP